MYRVVMVRKGKKVLDQKLVREKTFILKIDGNIRHRKRKKSWSYKIRYTL